MIHLEQLGSTLKGETYPEPSYRSPHRISSMLEERTGILFGENNSNIFKKKIEKTSVMGSMLERMHLSIGSLMWFWGVVEHFLTNPGCSACWQTVICRPPCTSRFPVIIFSNSARMLSCKFSNFAKSQTDILNTFRLV